MRVCNPVLADCPPIKEEHSMLDKSSGHREQQIDISYDLVGILPASLLGDLSNGETA